MRRLLALGLVIAVALVAAVPTSGATPPRRGFAFLLHAGGYRIEAQSPLGSGRVRLLLQRHGAVAYYYTAAQVGPGTIRGRFGRLGSLDLRFSPDRGEGPLGCAARLGEQLGTFRGRIVFRGEHDYADVDAQRARGYFGTRPGGGCDGDPATASATTPALRPIAETGAELEGVTGSSRAGRFFYFYSENRAGGVRSVFNAFRFERREGMLIERGAQVTGGARSFDWDLGTGTALVEPPAPFAGRASFRGGSNGGSSRWSGSLRVPILGGAPMRLTGAAFGAHLGRGT